MRVLIITALVALASASPIGEEAAATTAAPAIPEAAPESSPADDAPIIDATVLAEDQAQLAADQAQMAADQAQHAMDQARMFSVEALNQQKEKLAEQEAALKAAQAELDGAIAANAQLLARSVYTNNILPGVIPAGLPVIPPVVYDAKPGEALPEPAKDMTRTLKPEEPKAVEPEAAKPEAPKEATPTAQLGQIGLLTAPLTIPGYTFPQMASVAPLTFTAPLTYIPNPSVPLYQPPLVAAIPRSQYGF